MARQPSSAEIFSAGYLSPFTEPWRCVNKRGLIAFLYSEQGTPERTGVRDGTAERSSGFHKIDGTENSVSRPNSLQTDQGETSKMKTVTVLGKEIERYENRTPGSKALWEKARRVMPMGTASNSRMYEPYPLFIA